MAGMQLAPFNRRQALYGDLPPSSGGRRDILHSPGAAGMGLPVPMYGRRRVMPDTYISGMSGPVARIPGYQELAPRMAGIDPRQLAMGPLRRMPVQHSIPVSVPYFEEYDMVPPVMGCGGGHECGGMKPRAMSHPQIFPHVYEMLCSPHAHGNCGCFFSAAHGNDNSGSNSNSTSGSGSSSSSGGGSASKGSGSGSKDKDSSSGGGSGSKSDFDFKTKDIIVRGKVYTVRASYLSEAPKFEADLVKFMDKKKEDVVPSRVVAMLVSYINVENYKNTSFLDEVTLNIVTSNVGAKSVGEYSLGRLKKCVTDGTEIDIRELSEIVIMTMCSERVDEKLKEWLKSYIKHGGERGDRLPRLLQSRAWEMALGDRPEAETRLLVLLGVRRKEEEGEYRIL